MKTIYTYTGVLKKVVDGDTLDVIIDMGFSMFTVIRFRLFGLDTAEVNSKDLALRQRAMDAKAFVVQELADKDLTIHSFGKDKYGRYLGIVSVAGSPDSINDLLVAKGLAKPYFGDGPTTVLWD